MTFSSMLGMRGTGDFSSNQLPENYRAGMLMMDPNGAMTLTGMTGMLASERTDKDEFSWNRKDLPTQSASFTAGQIYTNATLVTAYTASPAAVAGDVLYIKLTAANMVHFREGQQVLIRKETRPDLDVNGKIIQRQVNGASSFIGVRLLEDDDNSLSSPSTVDLSDADIVTVIGNINAQGADRPGALSYSPEDFSNSTQIFRTALSLTRTALRTKLRTEDARKEAKREALVLHGIEMEKAFLMGIENRGTGSNGQPEHTTRGIIADIKANAPTNVFNYRTDADFTAMSWDVGGEAFFDKICELIFRYGSLEKMVICGSGFIKGFNTLAKRSGQFELTSETAAYGIKVLTYVSAFGKLMLKSHPLFHQDAVNRYRGVVIEPKYIKYRYIDDTFFKEDKTLTTGGGSGRDGINEEWVTECGLEFLHPSTNALIDGVGLSNLLS